MNTATDTLLPLTLDELLTTTRSVRKRLDLTRPVPRELVERAVDIARQAPNGTNRQTWNWLLIDDPEIRVGIACIYNKGMAIQTEIMQKEMAASNTDSADGHLAESITGKLTESVAYLAEHLHEVPMLLVPTVKCDFDGANLFTQASYWGSILPAVWNFQLAPRARGLGSAWTSVSMHCQKEMIELLNIPAGHTHAGVFPIAYTKGVDFKAGPRGPLNEVVHWNDW